MCRQAGDRWEGCQMKDSVREKVREIEWKKCEGIVAKWLSRALASPLKSPEPLSITTWSKTQYMKIFPGPRSSSCRHFCPAFISTTRPASLMKSNRNTNHTPLLHVSYQRQIPQIFVYPVDSSGILCLLRAPRVQYSQTRQRGHQSNWDTEMCGCVCVCVPVAVFQ